MKLIICLILLAVLLFTTANFLIFIESRHGFTFTDPILELLPAYDLTVPIFILLYGIISSAIFFGLKYRNTALLLILSYCLLLTIRIPAMYLLPLDPPNNMIILIDPVVEIFGTGKTLTRDLFFSGHTATIFLFFFCFRKYKWGFLYLIAGIFMGILVLFQHVHYSIDVFAAPVFAYFAYRLAVIINNYFNG